MGRSREMGEMAICRRPERIYSFGDPNCSGRSTGLPSNQMYRFRLFVLLVFLVVPTAATWASVFAACDQAKSVMSVRQSSADVNTHHGDSAHSSHSTTTSAGPAVAHGHNSMQDDAPAADCPCCGDCMSMCSAPGCVVPATSCNSFYVSYVADNALSVSADTFRAGPAPHPLFRPPISTD